MKVGDLVQIAEPFRERCEDPNIIGIIVKIDTVQHNAGVKPYYRIMFKDDYVWLLEENIQPLNQNRTKNVLDNIAG